jgi:hypothetical protein
VPRLSMETTMKPWSASHWWRRFPDMAA